MYNHYHYQMPTQLIINDHIKLEKLASEEWPTQRDVAAMAMANYQLCFWDNPRPLVNDFANKIATLILNC